uniref:Uncharacterized protein n=1 Tax=Meloidogyne incognita TaxID=6306 RepID=A0A914NKP1_MELIC
NTCMYAIGHRTFNSEQPTTLDGHIQRGNRNEPRSKIRFHTSNGGKTAFWAKEPVDVRRYIAYPTRILQPCENAARQPCENAARQPCENAARQPCENAARQPCENAARQPCENAARQPCEIAVPMMSF